MNINETATASLGMNTTCLTRHQLYIMSILRFLFALRKVLDGSSIDRTVLEV